MQLAVMSWLVASIASAQDAHVRQGVAYFKQEQYAKALEEFQQAQTTRADDALVHNLIGITDTKLGQVDEANRYYKLAIGLDPKPCGAIQNGGQLTFDFTLQLGRRSSETGWLVLALGGSVYPLLTR